MRWLRALAALVVVVSLASAAHVTYAFVQPVSGPDRVAAQVAWLDRAIDDGAPQRMQALFPEGAFFTQVLTGLAAASVDDEPTVAAMLAASAEPSVKDGFGTIAALDGGTFYRGWRLLLLAEQARLTGQGHRELLAEADAVRHALDAAATGVPPSYPEQYWPCDAVVAMAAVVRAHEAAHQPLHPVALADWRTKLNRLRDPASGLLGHQIDVFGHVLRGHGAVRRRSFRRTGPTSTRRERPSSGSASPACSWCANGDWSGCANTRSAPTPPETSTRAR